MDIRALCFSVVSWGVLLSASLAFGGDTGPPELLWLKQFGGAGHYLAVDVKEVAGNGFIVAGSMDRVSHLIRLDPSGEVMWDMTLGGDRALDVVRGVEVIDDGFIVAGESWSCSKVHSCTYLVKVSAAGEVLWERRIPNGLFEQVENRNGGAVDVTTAIDGGFVFLGHTEIGARKMVFVSKTDAQGKLEWETPIDEGEWKEDCCIRRIRDSEYIVGSAAAADDVVLVRLDSRGRVMWRRLLSGPIGVVSVEETFSGFVLAGYTHGTGGYVFRTNERGTQLWRGQFTDKMDFLLGARRLADGEYALAGILDRKATLIKVDEAGEISWETVFIENNANYVKSFEVTSDGGYIAAVNTYIAGQFNFVVARFSPTGVGRFIRGDANDDARLNLADPIFSLSYLLGGGEVPTCLQAADTDDDGEIKLTDSIFLLQHLFQAGPQPPAPLPDCGIDTTLDALECAGAKSCGV